MEPRILVGPTHVGPSPIGGQWRIRWRIENLDAKPIELRAAWLPHGRFRCPRQALVPPPRLAAGESAEIELTVAVAGASGEVVENAFLVLDVLRAGDAWQLFGRIRVVFGASGAPAPVIEVITAQRVGFSR